MKSQQPQSKETFPIGTRYLLEKGKLDSQDPEAVQHIDSIFTGLLSYYGPCFFEPKKKSPLLLGAFGKLRLLFAAIGGH